MEAYRSGVGGDGGDDEEENKGDDHLQEEGVHGGNGRHGGSAREEGVVDALEGEGRAHGGGHLRDDVSRHVRPGEVVEDGEGDGDGGVEMGPEMWPVDRMTIMTARPAQRAFPKSPSTPRYFWLTMGAAVAPKMRMNVPRNSAPSFLERETSGTLKSTR